MQVKEMNQSDCRAVLRRASLGRLGCSFEEQPYVVPVNIASEDDSIYIFSTFGQKIKWMRANPKVCVQVDEITDPARWTSVVAYGRYHELPETEHSEEREHARKLLNERHHWWLNALAERRMKVHDVSIAPLFFRVQIDSITGLEALPDE